VALKPDVAPNPRDVVLHLHELLLGVGIVRA